MTGVLIERRTFGHRKTYQEECMWKLDLRCQKPMNFQKLREIPGTDPSLGNFKEIIAHRHLNLELLSSRTVRQQMSVVSAIGFVILCNGGPRKLTQCLISQSTWTWWTFLIMTPSCAGDLPQGVKFGQCGLPPEEKPWAAESLLLLVGHEVETLVIRG